MSFQLPHAYWPSVATGDSFTASLAALTFEHFTRPYSIEINSEYIAIIGYYFDSTISADIFR
jgi:hypothetical protein